MKGKKRVGRGGVARRAAQERWPYATGYRVREEALDSSRLISS
jgi:hypothetical protein